MGNLAKGKASFSFNYLETEAILVFVPDPDEVGWDIAAVNKLAAEHQLGAYPEMKTLEAFLSKAARAKTSEPMQIVYAQGLEPQASTGEKISWEDLFVPGDIAPFKEETLGKAPAPVLFRIKVEKIKHETKVNKPGALPFMQGKEEVAVSWEKKETREKADVNTKVLEVKYASKGTKLGTVESPVPGKPGKSIFGKQIPAPQADNEAFLLGEGISKDKNEIFALVSGFIRIGENWADMVPLAKSIWKIYTGLDGVTLYFDFEPGDPRFPTPSAEDVMALAMENGVSEGDLVSVNELDKAIKEAIKSKEPVSAFALLRVQEAEAKVVINPEKTKATLYLRKGLAGALPLAMKDISQAIKDSKVQGYDSEELKTLINNFISGKDLVLEHVLVEGTPSTRGQDREVQVTVSPLSAEEKKPVLSRLKEWSNQDVSKKSEFDLNKEMDFAFVEKGALIATVSAYSEGETGKDIFGNEIPGLPGNDPDIKLSSGLDFIGNEIRASRNGLLMVKATEKSFRGEVINWQDAKIEIHISEDVMEVKGDFFRGEGAGISLTLTNVKKTFANLGIVKGIDWHAVEEACVIARAKGNVLGHVLARGQQPLAKGDSAIKWLVLLNSTGSAQVKAGTPIAMLSEPLSVGKPGYDVKGTEIPAEQATPNLIEYDDSVRGEPHGKGKRIIAAHSGDLRFDGKSIKIISVKTIDGDTDEHLKFSGEIRVKGNLLPGCMVMTGSHVLVSGFAEEALVSSGGKFVAINGIKGGGRGIIKAKTGIDADFTERASLVAMGDIKLKKGSVLSIIRTNGKLLISDENGTLSGGICQARLGIEAAGIGSEMGHRTEISFGQDYFLKDKINAYVENIAKLSKGLPKALAEEKIKQAKILEHLKLELLALRDKFEEHFDSEIVVHDVVFPGVVIESHNRYYEIKQKRNGVVFYFDRKTGAIKERPL